MKEALKLALELKNSASAYWTEKEILIIEKLIDSLAQPEQKCPNLVNCKGLCFQCEYFDLETGETNYPKPAQEPVYLAWFYEEEGWFETTKDHYDITDEEDRWLLYTAPPKPTAQNFCSRCGKRTPDLTTIHTCTPPHGLEMT